MDSPARIPFASQLACVSACLIVFATSVRDVASVVGRPTVAAYFIGFMALSATGVGVFAYPHPLHGIFGLSQLIAYLAPLILAWTWRGDSRLRPVVSFSWVMAGLLWTAVALNLSSFDRHGAVFAYTHSFYGLLQKSLFVLWFGWCAVLGVLLFRRNAVLDRTA